MLAIDQAPKEKEGQNTLVGRTATLELKPEQIPTLAAARQAGTLSLALRSIADAKAGSEGISAESQPAGVNLEVIRYGVANRVTVKK